MGKALATRKRCGREGRGNVPTASRPRAVDFAANGVELRPGESHHPDAAIIGQSADESEDLASSGAVRLFLCAA